MLNVVCFLLLFCVVLPREFYTASQAAELLSIRKDKILSWLRSGKLKGADLSETPGRGRARWRIARADLLDFLEGRTPKQEVKPTRRRKPTRPAGWVQYF